VYLIEGVDMGFRVINRDGVIVGYAPTWAEALAILDSVPDDIYTFFVGGSDADVQAFLLRLNRRYIDGKNFFDLLKEKYGRVPEQINPFEEIKSFFIGANSLFIKIRADLINASLAAQLFGVLQVTMPAGSCFFLILEKREISETYNLGEITESVVVFYVPETTDTVSGFEEAVLVSGMR